MNLTSKQIEILTVIAAGVAAGEAPDLSQIVERVRYMTTKESMQFSIRALIKHGLVEKLAIEKRRGRAHRPIGITPAGQGYAGKRDKNDETTSLSEDDLDLEIVELTE